MFISTKELDYIRKQLAALAKEIKNLKLENKTMSKFIKEQKELNKKYDESLGKRYIHEAFENKSQEEIQSLIDEWQNGEEKTREVVDNG